MEGTVEEWKTKFREYMEKEIIKLVKKTQSKNFCWIYWNLSVKYNHTLVWIWQLITCAKWRKKARQETEFELLKPLSRFYHFINAWNLLLIWWIATFIIAIYREVSSSSTISIGFAVAIVIIAIILGDIAILGSIKALYAVYMKNIWDAFELGDKLAPPRFHPVIWSKTLSPTHQ